MYAVELFLYCAKFNRMFRLGGSRHPKKKALSSIGDRRENINI